VIGFSGSLPPPAKLPAVLAAVVSVTLGPLSAAADDDAASAISSATVPEPPGYRLDDYRAPTPATIVGGTAVSTADLRVLLKTGNPILIDVLPNPRRPDNLPAGTLWLPKVRKNIPGSVWLPEVGRGALNADVESYFRSNLARLTGGARDRRLVFYCLATCWMSWNAAKRAISYGYQAVYWYRDGTDGWSAAGLPTEKSEPVPMIQAGN
jgi:PQQ-dependent catabolism-associated CXXCW motif protein